MRLSRSLCAVLLFCLFISHFASAQTPVISSLNPSSAEPLDQVTISGSNFGTRAGTVTLNGQLIEMDSWSDTSIKVGVPAAASSGNIVVNNGVQSNGMALTVLQPVITAITPAGAAPNAVVTIAGNYFGRIQGTVSSVTFNGQQASIVSWSDSSIQAWVPVGASSGPVVVNTWGALQSPGFSYTVAPIINSILPANARPGDSVTISGKNFTGTTGSVSLNSTPMSVSSWSNAAIVVTVPNSVTGGNVTVTAGTLASNTVGLGVLRPGITSLSPIAGTSGATVTISGAHFGDTTGSVTFNGQPATVSSWSDSSITVTVPASATTGNVVVSSGGFQSNGVSFIAGPAIRSLAPAQGIAGTPVTITGYNFGSTLGTVTFNGVQADVINWSNTSIVATVPSTAGSGVVALAIAGQPLTGPIFVVPTVNNAWDQADIGTVSSAGSTSVNGTAYTVSSYSGSLGGVADSLHYVFQPVSGNFDMIAHATVVTQSDTHFQYGITIRDSLAAGGMSLSCIAQPGSLEAAAWRAAPNASGTDSPGVVTANTPIWLRVRRYANTFQCLYSNNGTSWAQLQSTHVVGMNVNAVAGISVMSYNQALAQVTFDNISITAAPAQAASPWLQQDMGTMTGPGDATYNGTVFTVSSNSNAFQQATSDNVHYVFQPASGDLDLITHVSWDPLASNVAASAGIMVRQSLAPDDSEFSCLVLPFSHGAVMEVRTIAGLNNAEVGIGSSSTVWVKLSRRGSLFSCYYSSDGASWTLGQTREVPMAQSVEAGLVQSSTNGGLDVASFQSVSMSGFPALPGPWQQQDIGTVTGPGNATLTNGTFSVESNSMDIAGSADNLHFVYQQVSGDLNIIGHMTWQQVSSGSSKAGVMVRQSLDASSPQISCLEDFFSRIYSESRATAGASDQISQASGTQPLWFKLIRQGSTFTCYTSTDGNTWTSRLSTSISMSSNVYVGLAVSGFNGNYSLATFDNVTLQANLPTATITYPVNNSTVYLSRPVTLTASVVPSPGATITGVEFFDGQTSLGQVTGSPYSITVPGLPATGGHTYSARVTDSAGLSAGSPSSAVTIANPQITVVSPNHGGAGTQVRVTGVGFGSTRGGSSLNFNSVPATVTGWSDTEVDAIVPSGAGDGPMSMTFPDGASADGAPNDFSPCAGGGNCVIDFTISPTVDLTDGQHPITAVVTTAKPTLGIQVAQTLGLQCAAPATAFWQSGMPGSGGCQVTSPTTKFTLSANLTSASGISTLIAALPCSLFGCPDPGISKTVTLVGQGQAVGSTEMGSRCPTCGQPIHISTGNTYIQQSDYALPGLGGGISVGRTWNSLWTTTGPLSVAGMFGHSWRASYEDRLQTTSSGISYWLDDGKVWRFSSSNGTYTLTSPVDARGILTYDSTAQQYTLTFVNGTKQVFGSDGYLSRIIDRNGNQTTLTYDGSKRLTQVTDTANRVLTFNYGDASNPNQVTSIQDASGVIATYAYGTSSQLLSVTYADSSQILFNYDTNLLITSVTDGAGKVLEAHTYDGQRRGLTSQRANGVELVTVSYPSAGVSLTFDSSSNSTSYGYGLIGERSFANSVSGPGCSTCGMRGFEQYVYDSQGNVTTSFDSNGIPTLFTYDGNANVTSRSTPVNDHLVTSQYTYNGFGELLTATDPLGHVTTNTYDANGNLLTVTTPAPDAGTPASATTFAYDTLGQLTSITDPLNHVTTLAYYPTGLLHTVTDAQNNVTTYEYDARGNRTAVVDALSNRTTFDYNARNRLTVIHNPDTSTVSFGYDARGRRTSVTDGNGKVTQYAYDDADRLTSVTDANNHVTTYGYDLENNLTSITDANNHTTSFQYDTQQHLTKTTFPSTKFESYTYDNVGNLMTKTDRKNQTVSYDYDTMNRLISKTYPDSTSVVYTYDDASRLTQVQDPTGTYSFLFDNMGRLKQTTTTYSFVSGNPFTIVYGYDAASNRTGVTDPNNGNITYTYDTLNRLTNIQDYNNNNFGFSYDALSRRTQMTRPNGINTNYGYDALSNLQSILHQAGVNTLDGATYTYDHAGNRTSKTNLLNSTTSNYTYDNIYQLTGVTAPNPESYTYDPVGNRLTSQNVPSYSYNSSNELTAAGTTTYTYDDNGNTLTKADSSGTTTYNWDFQNRLTSVQSPNSSTVSFKYDPFGRRIQKGSSVFVYEGPNLIQETNTGGSTVARYVFGSGIDEPLATYRGASSGFYEADGLGSVTSLSTAAGVLSDSFSYDSFGNLLSSTGSFPQPFRYTGRESDVETGLFYYRARYYDSMSGRFLSEDPLGFKAAMDFYSYVGNDPTNGIDPLGWSALPTPTPAPGPIIINLEGPAIVALFSYEVKLGAEFFRYGQAIRRADAADAQLTQAEHNVNQAILANMQWWNDLITAKDSKGNPLFDPYKKPGRCKGQTGCRPCDPPVGTISYQQAGPNAIPHYPFGSNHWHLWEMHQAPASQGCFCFWVELGVGTGSPPSKAQAFPGPAGGGGPK